MPQQQYILNRLHIGLILLDPEFRVCSYNRAAATMLGEDRLCNNLGQPIQSMHSPQASAKIDWLLQQARGDAQPSSASMLINLPDTVLQLRVTELRNDRETTGYALVVYDITELDTGPHMAEDAVHENAAAQPLLKLPVSLNGKTLLLDVEQICFVRAEGHYTRVHSSGQSYFCSLSLSQIEPRLPHERFLRVHRSYIINLARAHAICRDSDHLVISIEGDATHDIPVSRGNMAELRKRLGV